MNTVSAQFVQKSERVQGGGVTLFFLHGKSGFMRRLESVSKITRLTDFTSTDSSEGVHPP